MLKGEVSWANHIGITAVLFPTVRSEEDVDLFCQAVNEALQLCTFTQVSYHDLTFFIHELGFGPSSNFVSKTKQTIQHVRPMGMVVHYTNGLWEFGPSRISIGRHRQLSSGGKGLHSLDG